MIDDNLRKIVNNMDVLLHMRDGDNNSTACGDVGEIAPNYYRVTCHVCLRIGYILQTKAAMRYRGDVERWKAAFQELRAEHTADLAKPAMGPWFRDEFGTVHRQALFGPSFMYAHPDGKYHVRLVGAGGVIDKQGIGDDEGYADQSWTMYLIDGLPLRNGWRLGGGSWVKDRGEADIAALPLGELR